MSTLDLDRIIKGNCLDVLRTFPDNFFDSCVSDVPYGLGPKDPTPEQILAYLQGEELDTGGDFMGKRWAIPSVNVWKEVYRVLKPGGHVLSFGGTRTFDLISIGLRFAGFENRDTIAEDHPLIQWCYGSGMPKSSDIGKSLAKKRARDEKKRKGSSKITLEDIERWTGWGYGMKPSWEPILVFRKPFKGALFANVLKYGTGGYNIDATRVAHASKEDFEEHKKQVEAVKSKGGVRGNSWKNASDLSGANDVNPNGRFTANKVMTHHPQCVLEGVEISTSEISVAEHSLEFTDQRPVWKCHEGCPIRTLDEMSGDRPATLTGRADPTKSHAHPGTQFNDNSTFLGKRDHHSNVYADDGGASKYFKQFKEEKMDLPFHFSSKANRKEAGGGVFRVKHPTPKPLSLMQYLIRLVTPPGGVVLDHYCGSGSTLHAAVLERCHYIGIELGLEGEYDEAVKRMGIIHEQLDDLISQEELFEFAMSDDD